MTGYIWNKQMESCMLFQSATPAECLVTFQTGKWLLSCVDPFMIFKSQLSVNDWSHFEQASGVLHALSKCHSSWMSCHISNRQMTSLLCGSFHDFQITTICKWLVTFGTGKGGMVGKERDSCFPGIEISGKIATTICQQCTKHKTFHLPCFRFVFQSGIPTRHATFYFSWK